jgi:hypothetical protein
MAEGTENQKASAMSVMKLKQKLENPFALVAQGFVVGVILFWATLSDDSNAQPPAQSAATVAAAPYTQS